MPYLPQPQYMRVDTTPTNLFTLLRKQATALIGLTTEEAEAYLAKKFTSPTSVEITNQTGDYLAIETIYGDLMYPVTPKDWVTQIAPQEGIYASTIPVQCSIKFDNVESLKNIHLVSIGNTYGESYFTVAIA